MDECLKLCLGRKKLPTCETMRGFFKDIKNLVYKSSMKNKSVVVCSISEKFNKILEFLNGSKPMERHGPEMEKKCTKWRDLDKECLALNKDSRKLIKECLALNKDSRNLNKKKRASLRNLKTYGPDLNKECRDLNRECRDLNNDGRYFNKECRELNRYVREMNKSDGDLDKEWCDLIHDCRDLIKEGNELNQECRELNKECRDLNKVCLDEDGGDLDEDGGDLNNYGGDLTHDCRDLTECRAWNKECRDLNAERSELIKECRGLNKEYHELMNGCASCDFRSTFQLVLWCGEKVFNVKGSSLDTRNKDASWINIWRKMFEMTLGKNCQEVCRISKPVLNKEDALSRKTWENYLKFHPLPGDIGDDDDDDDDDDETEKIKNEPWGGHVEKEFDDDFWYILPICPYHNYRDKFDRGGQVMTTSPVAFAVRIPKMTDEEIERRRKEEKAIEEEKKPQKEKKNKKPNKRVQTA